MAIPRFYQRSCEILGGSETGGVWGVWGVLLLIFVVDPYLGNQASFDNNPMGDDSAALDVANRVELFIL